jgi:hypothetical protein
MAPLLQNHGIGFANYISRQGKVLEAMMIPWSDEITDDLSSGFLGESDSAAGGVSVSRPGIVISSWSFQNASTGRPLLCACLGHEVTCWICVYHAGMGVDALLSRLRSFVLLQYFHVI